MREARWGRHGWPNGLRLGVGYLARRSLLWLIPDPEFRHALRRRFCTVPERPRSHGGLQGLLVAGLPTPGHGELDLGPLGRLLSGFLARAVAIAGSLRLALLLAELSCRAVCLGHAAPAVAVPGAAFPRLPLVLPGGVVVVVVIVVAVPVSESRADGIQDGPEHPTTGLVKLLVGVDERSA